MTPEEEAALRALAEQEAREFLRSRMYAHIEPELFHRYIADLTAEGWNDVRAEAAVLTDVFATLADLRARLAAAERDKDGLRGVCRHAAQTVGDLERRLAAVTAERDELGHDLDDAMGALRAETRAKEAAEQQAAALFAERDNYAAKCNENAMLQRSEQAREGCQALLREVEQQRDHAINISNMAVAARREAEQQRDTLRTMVNLRTGDLEKALEQLATARAALKLYGHHGSHCGWRWDKPCTCGLDVALSAPEEGK